jgi:tripartite-type tricarboxylate transporter receptor subunit TctC
MMQNITRRAFTAAAVTAGVVSVAQKAPAQRPYPAGATIKFVVPFVAGGITDTVGRIVAGRLGELWNVPTVVENVAGSGANIGNDRVAKGPTDGSQVLIMTPSFATNKFMYARLAYDPEKDIVPLAQVASSPNLLCVRKGLPVASVAELIAYAKANPGKLNFASGGVGTTIHLSGELFKRMAGVEMVHVPYRGSTPALTDLIGENIDLMFDTIGSIMGQAREGNVKALGVTSLSRSSFAPEFPPIADTLPGFDVFTFYGVGVRTGTAKEICDAIERDTQVICHQLELRDRLKTFAAETVPSSAAEFASMLASERKKWGKVISELKIRTD